MQLLHDPHADHGFARAAGQDDDAAAAVSRATSVEDVHGLLLVVTQSEWLAALAHRTQEESQQRAGDVARQVFGWIADQGQCLLDVPATSRIHHQRTRVSLSEDVGDQSLVAHQFGDERHVIGNQQQLAIFSDQLDPPVAGDVIQDVYTDVVGQRIFAVVRQSLDDGRGGGTGGRGVPEGERSDAVGVDVLRTLLQLGEAGQGIAGLFVEGVVYFQEDCLVPLDDQRILWVVSHAKYSRTGLQPNILHYMKKPVKNGLPENRGLAVGRLVDRAAVHQSTRIPSSPIPRPSPIHHHPQSTHHPPCPRRLPPPAR